MIEQALYEHLTSQADLRPFLATYDDAPAIFNQEAPADTDPAWGGGPQYGRIVFAVDLQGDPERTMGGTLTVDILCNEEDNAPEEIEPIIRSLIDGYFFSNGTFTTAAQWKNSSYFTEETDHIIGCTIGFELLGFPVLTTYSPDVIDRANEWTSDLFKGVHVINHSELPEKAWTPADGDSAVYWRLVAERPANWIRDTYYTIWRTATIKCHIFSEDNATAAKLAREITRRLYAGKRLLREGEAPIMVNRNNTIDLAADPLRTGQLTVEATYGIVVGFEGRDLDSTITKIAYN